MIYGEHKDEYYVRRIIYDLKGDRQFLLNYKQTSKEGNPMQAIYRLNARELNEQFLEGLKLTFGEQDIEIIVSQFDETDYLLRSPANQERLLTAIENVKQGKNLVEINLDQL